MPKYRIDEPELTTWRCCGRPIRDHHRTQFSRIADHFLQLLEKGKPLRPVETHCPECRKPIAFEPKAPFHETKAIKMVAQETSVLTQAEA